MSDGTDEISTDQTTPDLARFFYAEQAAKILEKTRRAAPFVAAPALPATDIIALAEYLRIGSLSAPLESPSDDERGEFVPVMQLQVGDVFNAINGPHVVIRPPVIQGTLVRVKIRPERGGTAHDKPFDLDTTVEVIRRAAEKTGFETIRVGQLMVDDVVLDFGDGPIEGERVVRLEPTSFGHRVVETMRGTEKWDQVLNSAHRVTVKFPRYRIPSKPVGEQFIPITELRVNDVLIYNNDARDRVTDIQNAKGTNDAVEITLEGVVTKKPGKMTVPLDSEETVCVELPRR